MANLSDVFTESERTNWLKAWLAIDIAKSGLEQFAEDQAKILQGNIYNAILTSGAVACTGCHTANLLKCPSPGICNKQKANSLCKSMHDTASKQPRQCPANVCNKVLIEIAKQHKFAKPSWKNTEALDWASCPWQIAKAYLPPDGYTEKGSAQDTDFNGIISFMMNCKHFDNKFSFPIAQRKTHQPCFLTKARDIGRTVRHSSMCKVADTYLQDMFITLTSLLTDQQCLANDVAAHEAVRKLAKLQTDVLKLTTEEIVNLLEAAQDKLKQVEHIPETAIDEIRIYIENCKKDLNAYTDKCKKELDDHTGRCKEEFDEHRRKSTETDYSKACIDFRRRLMAHYDITYSNVPLSNLDQSFDKRIEDIYATPKIHRIKIEKNGKRIKQEQVLTYTEIFYTDESNRRIYLQGEPGSGKSTFSARIVHDWSHINQVSPASPFSDTTAFDDVLTIQKFKFLFLVTLRDSRYQTDVSQMIKKQLIDTAFSEDERADVYKLFVQIMNSEICLVIREGLDEWVPPTGSNLAEPSLVGFQKDTCTVLTTSRPWKLADERIKNSQIDSLLEIEGISNPYAFSENIIRSLIDDTKDLRETTDKFQSFMYFHNLEAISSSPMLYTLVICTWVNEIEEDEYLKESSLCALYTTLLESLCKKANMMTGYFNDSNLPPVHCFSGTSYLQPNIEHLDQLAKAACKLLFSSERESSIVFSDMTLSNYFSPQKFTMHKAFALQAGILTNRKDKTRTGNSNSFVHKTLQEYFTAYHIACNPHVIDDVISTYLKSNYTSYLEISQVLIFLCGMNTSAANKLSNLMAQYDLACCSLISREKCEFQRLIESGIREAAANNHDIQLKLSHFHIDKNNIRDINNIWSTNTSNVQELYVHINKSDFLGSAATEEPPSHFEFNVSSCHNLRELNLCGGGIWLRDAESTAPSEFSVWIILNSKDPAKISDTPLVLPSIEEIYLESVTCSSTCLHSLFRTMLTLDHCVKCTLNCDIISCVDGSDKCTNALIMASSDSEFRMLRLRNDSPGLWEALNGLNIKSLSLGLEENILVFDVNHKELFLQFLSSLNHLETLRIVQDSDFPSLLKAMRCLNIKRLSLSHQFFYEESLSESLSSLTHLETLSIIADKDCLVMWEALRGLNINSLNLSMEVNYIGSLSRSLSSLTQLKTLKMSVRIDCPGLWKAPCVQNITSLSLDYVFNRSSFYHVDSLSQSLPSLKRLKTHKICVSNDSSVLWEALRGLNITSLHLDIPYGGLKMNHVESSSKTLSSLAHLKTLSISVFGDSPGLLEALCGLNITCLSLILDGRLSTNRVELPSQYRLSLKHLETLSIDVNDDIPSLWTALHGLNIKSLTLKVRRMGLKHVESMSQSLSSFAQLETLSVSTNLEHSSSLLKVLHGLDIKNLNLNGDGLWITRANQVESPQSLSSLKQLETLSISVHNDSPGLWKAMTGLNIKSLSLSGWPNGDLRVNSVESMSQSLSSLTQLETLSISEDIDSPALWQALRGLHIKSLSLSNGGSRGLVVNHVESMSQSLSSLRQLGTLSICVSEERPGLWGALCGLNIKRLSLSGRLRVNNVELLSESISSLTQLETLSVSVKKYSPGLWEALRCLNIKSLSFSDKWGDLRVNHAESLSQSLPSPTQLS